MLAGLVPQEAVREGSLLSVLMVTCIFSLGPAGFSFFFL